MRGNSSSRSFLKYCSNAFISHCDSAADIEKPELIQAADAAAEERLKSLRIPPSFETLRKQIVSQASVNTYDGFRMIVQKQINLNTIVSHFYWIGSTQMQQPLYQYRLILNEDDYLINVATDMDFNIEGEIKFPVIPNTSAKINLVINDNSKSIDGEINYTGSDCSSQLKLSRGETNLLQGAYMQGILPFLSLGGSFQYDITKDVVSTAFGGLIDYGENQIAAVYDDKFQIVYLRRVNPNRVHLMTDLLIDANGNSTMSLTSQYFLKQSKIEIGFDSNLLIRSTLETNVYPGLSLAFAGEMLQASNHFKFGTAVTLGG